MLSYHPMAVNDTLGRHFILKHVLNNLKLEISSHHKSEKLQNLSSATRWRKSTVRCRLLCEIRREFSTIAYNDLHQKAILQFESLASASDRLVARQANQILSFSGRVALEYSVELHCISGTLILRVTVVINIIVFIYIVSV